jgi:hypothetical protein
MEVAEVWFFYAFFITAGVRQGNLTDKVRELGGVSQLNHPSLPVALLRHVLTNFSEGEIQCKIRQ